MNPCFSKGTVCLTKKIRADWRFTEKLKIPQFPSTGKTFDTLCAKLDWNVLKANYSVLSLLPFSSGQCFFNYKYKTVFI